MPDNNYTLPIAVAAEQLKTTQLHVLMLIKRKQLKAIERESQWYLEEDLFKAYLDQKQKPSAEEICAIPDCALNCSGCG